VGNVVSDGSTVDLKDFLNLAMRQVGLNTTEEDPIISCRSNAKFSFIEFRQYVHAAPAACGALPASAVPHATTSPC
jgi:hypothetical protein